MTMLPEVVGVEIDPRALVPCPATPGKPFRARYAARACPGCPHYRGLGLMATEGEWHQMYAIRCAHVIEQRTTILEVIEE